MILDLVKLVDKYNLDIKGVLHIGAHFGGEFDIYKKLGIKHMLFFEPIPYVYEILRSRVGNLAVNCALGNYNGKGEMYIASNQGMSSSLMEPLLHKKQYPQITYNETIQVDVCRLEDILPDPHKYNMINIDVEGYALEVFRGAGCIFETIDYIMTEVNNAELYRGCVLISELDVFLSGFGFERVEVDWAGGTWGDAFYIKNENTNLYTYLQEARDSSGVVTQPEAIA